MEAPQRTEPVSAGADTSLDGGDGVDEWVMLPGYSASEQLWYTLPPGTRWHLSGITRDFDLFEVIMHICSYLAPKDLCTFALVDSQCSSLASDDAVWMPLATRRWPEGVLPKKVVTTWKKIYAELASEEHGTAMRFVIDKTQFLCNTEGQDISGTVYLKLAYETQIRGLFVCFEGREFSRHRKGKHTDIRRHVYFSNYKTIAGRFAYVERSRENLVLPAGSHQFSFRIPVPAATDTGSPMERSVPNYSDRLVRYEISARLVRVGIFNFDITRSHVLEFRRPPPPDELTQSSPPAVVNFQSSYLFGQQMQIQVTLPRTHCRGGETMSVVLEVMNPSKWAVLSAEMDLYLESNTAGYRPLLVARTQRYSFPFRALGSATAPERQTLLMQIPADIVPNIHCRFFSMVWHVEVIINVELQLSPFYIRAPVEIVESPFPPLP